MRSLCCTTRLSCSSIDDKEELGHNASHRVTELVYAAIATATVVKSPNDRWYIGGYQVRVWQEVYIGGWYLQI